MYKNWWGGAPKRRSLNSDKCILKAYQEFCHDKCRVCTEIMVDFDTSVKSDFCAVKSNGRRFSKLKQNMEQKHEQLVYEK